jgi:hypothetical protein
MTAGALRIVAVADSDSYVKWAASLLAGWDGIEPTLLLLETPLLVSDAQKTSALSATGFPEDRVRQVSFDDLPQAVVDADADVVLLAGRGPLVRLVARELARLEPRPVLISGLPGIGIPARAAALKYRAQCDLFVVHSRREREAFGERAEAVGIGIRLGLTRLPFADARPVAGGDDLVFAAQAIVPREREDRVRVSALLVDAARADAGRRVVVKLRSAAGEKETHAEKHRYPDLIEALGPVPDNLVISYAPMSEALETAQGLLTVSSTAAIEAAGRGVPVIALDTFGISRPMLNEVFADSGMLAGEKAVIDRDFHAPDPAWLRDNYFHAPEDDDLDERVRELVVLRRAGALAPLAAPSARGGGLRLAWDRRRVLGDADTSVAGRVALVVGTPLRLALVARNRLRTALRRPPVDPVIRPT